MKPVKDTHLKANQTVKDLVKQFGEAGGFTAKKVSIGSDIVKKMFSDKDCYSYLSFPAAIISTGTRGIVKDLVKNKKVDSIVTTCGTLDHDLARLWGDYYQGSFSMDDKDLHKKNIHRLGNVLIKSKDYGGMLENKCQPVLERLYKKKKEWSTFELVWAFGEAIKDEKGAEETIVYWAWKNKIPVYLPGPLDGSWGSQLWNFWQTHRDFKINLFEDEQDLFIKVTDAKKTGAIMLGGGISKHHVIWWNQFREGLDYAVQITSAPEWDGSLSGAQTREAISWGKIKEEATHITIPGDVTVILPLVLTLIH